jgi:hypothetical protein
MTRHRALCYYVRALVFEDPATFKEKVVKIDDDAHRRAESIANARDLGDCRA